MFVRAERYERLERLRDLEEAARAEARHIELDPSRTEEARRLFRRASAARRRRLALLRLWRLA